MNWSLAAEDRELLEFVAHVSRVRHDHPVFRRRSFFPKDRALLGAHNVLWFGPDGREMSDEEWRQGFARCLGMYLAGSAIGETNDYGLPLTDDDFILLINAHHDDIPFLLPGFRSHVRWQVVIDTGRGTPPAQLERHPTGGVYRLGGRSLVLLQQSQARARRLASRDELDRDIAHGIPDPARSQPDDDPKPHPDRQSHRR